MENIKVVYPVSVQSVQDSKATASLPNLNGKTIALLWNYAFRGDETFPIIQREIKKFCPDIKFVDFEYFGNFHDPSFSEKVLASIPEKLKAIGCDAAIVGNGC